MAVKEHSELNAKLKELEEKIRALFTEVSRSRQEKKDLAASAKELESKLGLMGEQLNKERAEKEKLLSELKQRTDEREEIRSKVEGLLAEVTRIESNLGEMS
jgi:chromosome segregation ATPase